MTRLLLLCALALSSLPAAAQDLPDILGNVALQFATERGFPGDALFVSIPARNRGAAPTPDFPAAVYLSRDVYPSADDVFLGRVTVPGIAPQQNSSAGITVTLPDVPRGGYFVLAALDDPDTVVESDEMNNVNIGRFTMRPVLDGPDLLVSTGTLEDTQAAPGDRVSVEFVTANRGQSAVGDFEVGYYLSTDIYSSPDDVLMERETLGGLDADETEDESDQVTVPANTPPGDYSFIIVLDDLNTVGERNETNNTFRFFLRVTGTVSNETPAAPGGVSLFASPNPSSGMVRLSYALPEAAVARLTVYDVLGRAVVVIANGARAAGRYETAFDTASLTPGVYLARLDTDGELTTIRFTVTGP